jgi:TetR/AcrR family transcriptional regulator, cholesterol catabolism regulator
MDDKKIEIIEKATLVFLKYGIKSITMDDMARELVMSKKTIYQYFKDKNDLVKEIITFKTIFDQTKCECVKEEAENAIQELFQIGEYVSTMMKDIHPSVFYDLRKFHPEAWQILNNHKWKFVKNSILDNIKRGKFEKLYRNELNEEVIATMYVGSTDLISNGEAFSESNLNSAQLFLEMMIFQVHGMANEKGLIYLNELLKRQKK